MKLSSRIFIEHVAIRMQDGVNLMADITVSDDGKRYPVLLVRTPYSRTDTFARLNAIGLARDEWAVVIQNVRGRFDSEGQFRPFYQESRDGTDTVRWCAQQPWSNGRVVMTGESYAGITAWLCAFERPRELVAIAPQITTSDFYREWFYEGGGFRQAFVQSWALSLVFTDTNKEKEARQAWKIAEDLEMLYRTPPVSSPVGELFAPYQDWIAPSKETYWNTIRRETHQSLIDIPVFYIGGWYDIFCEGTLRDFVEMSTQLGDSGVKAQRLVMGPWTHSKLFHQQVGEVDYGLQANGFVQNVFGELIQWFRNVLDGKAVEEGAKVFVMGSNYWREFRTWPPSSDLVRIFLDAKRDANSLQGNGRLQWDPPSTGGDDYLRYEPWNPVPTRGGRTLDPTLNGCAGSIDQRPIESRSDVLVYTSDELGKDITIIGAVNAEIMVATNGHSADIAVKLVDVHPDGRALNIVNSIQRAEFTPGYPKRIQVELGSTAMVIKCGHRIRVEVSSSNFPHIDLNPSTEDISTRTIHFKGSEHKIYRGGINQSFITLPIINY